MSLDDYQSKVLEVAKSGHNCLVVATPGSGKTWTIEAVSRELPGEVLFLTHTRDARLVLQRRGIKASTIHSYCYKMLDYPLFNTFDCLLYYKGQQEYDWVVVDEAQDISYEQYQVVKSIGKRFIMVGDPYQSIFNFGPSGAYEEIFDDFKADFNPIECSLLYNYRSCSMVVARAELVYHRAMESRCTNKVRGDTAVLVRSRMEAEGISSMLKRRGVAHSLITGDYPYAIRGAKLQVMTAHCAKGTEFDRVIVKPWVVNSDMEQHLYYVALSRARHKVDEESSVSNILDLLGVSDGL